MKDKATLGFEGPRGRFGAATALGFPSVPQVAWSLDLPLRASILGVILGATVFERFGVDVGGYSVDFSLFAQYAVLGCLAASGKMGSDVPRALLLAGLLVVGLLSFMLNMQDSSATSLLLLIAIYLPFAISADLKGQISEHWRWSIDAFRTVALICAMAGIVQFAAQFVIHEPWLFNWTPLIPEPIRAIGVYNTVIPVGELHKSNGFFFREPSNFSQMMALALICDVCLKSRRLPLKLARMGVLGLALLLSYSGTGLLTFLVGIMFPLGLRTVGRALGLAALGGLVIVFLSDALNLSFTLNRISEFSSEGSSAFARFIAPLRLLGDGLDANFWTPVVGNGPGTISRLHRTYNLFDPTWAKAMYEYGVAGFALVMALILYTMNRYRSPAEFRAALFFCWLLMGGHLLSPGKTALVYVLAALCPAEALARRTSARMPSEKPTLSNRPLST